MSSGLAQTKYVAPDNAPKKTEAELAEEKKKQEIAKLDEYLKQRAKAGKLYAKIKDGEIKKAAQKFAGVELNTEFSPAKCFALMAADAYDTITSLEWAHSADGYNLKGMMSAVKHNEKGQHMVEAAKNRLRRIILQPAEKSRSWKADGTWIIVLLSILSVGGYLYFNPAAAREFALFAQIYGLHLIVSFTLIIGIVGYAYVRRRRSPKQ